jgi:hypothetical protein
MKVYIQKEKESSNVKQLVKPVTGHM